MQMRITFSSFTCRWTTVNVLLLIMIVFATWLAEAYKMAPSKKQVYNERDCDRPQSRIAYLEDEYPDYNSAAIYLPHAAIVQRCDNSVGCCQKGHRYVSTRKEDMVFHFQEFLHGNKTNKEVTLTNHLHCQCHVHSAKPAV